MRWVVGGLLTALALLPPAAAASATEYVVMRRDNFGEDFAFIDRFLKALAPNAYRPDESWDLPELTLGRVYVGRYDVNEDGRDELFVFARYSCGTVGCPTTLFTKEGGAWVPLFSDLAVLGDTRIDGERVVVMDVWTDPEDGDKYVFSEYEGFRWTGEAYEYLGDNEVVEVSARIPPKLGPEGGCVEPRGERLNYLMQYIDTGKHLCLMYDPNVRPALEALLGTEFLHLRKNLERHPGIGFFEGYLFVEGSRRETLRDWEETAMLAVNTYSGRLQVGIFSEDVRTIYARDKEWSYLPTLLRAWARGNLDPHDLDRPLEIVWIGRPEEEK